MTVKFSLYPGNLLSIAVLFVFLTSCTIVKNYPVRKPFVYQTNVALEGKYSIDEKKALTQRLIEQLHDSIRVRSISKIIGWDGGPKMFYTLLKSPALFDTLNIGSSKLFMEALLNSLGYHRGTIDSDTTLAIKNDQYRTTVNFDVAPGTLFTLDSIAYTIGTDSLQPSTPAARDTLQNITSAARAGSVVQKGEAFSIPLLAAERDRLANIFRNNGYLRFAN
ncbi:MAG: hypothetical protein WKF70_07155, partial [Chitinophagaceae bacterium]